MYSRASKKQLREFGILIGFLFPILLGWIIPAFRGDVFNLWTLWIGIIFLFLGITKPNSLYYPYKVWMKIGFILGWVNSRLILGFIFLFIVQPIAIIMKLLGHDPLRLKITKQKSYRETNKGHQIDLTKIF